MRSRRCPTEEADAKIVVEAGPETAEAEEVAVEAAATKVLEVKEARAEVSHVDPATLTGPQMQPARSIGNSGRGRGYVRTDITVHGETTKAPAQDITETWLQLK